MMRARVAERGQVTIPKVLRKKLGIHAGTVLDFQVQNGKLIGLKTEQDDPVSQVFGCLGKVINTDQIIRELRGKA